MTREAFICDFGRSAFGRYGGSLAPVRPDDLAAAVIGQVIERNKGLDPATIDDAIFGCANQAGEDNRNIARMAVLLAGLPDTIPGATVNRLCGSGLDAVGSGARAIRSGDAEIILAGGVESMSRAPFVLPKATSAYSRSASIEDTTIGWRFVNKEMKRLYGVDSMPETAENVAEDFGISRHDQDVFAVESQRRAAAARAGGRFAKEIVPIRIPQRAGDPQIVDTDEHLRPETTLEGLAKLRAPFREGGSVTAGNASGVNDGAAALILASESGAKKAGLEPIARVLGMTAAGVPPRIMGFGPAPASKRLCDMLGLAIDDFAVIELNEAFASQALAVLRDLGVEENSERVNPNGGAIALGHPLGASGARLAGTAALQLKRAGDKALVTMCIGVGQGIALALEKV